MARVKMGEGGPRYVAMKRTKGAKSVPGGRKPKKKRRGQGKP
jgi:hypothetical protein